MRPMWITLGLLSALALNGCQASGHKTVGRVDEVSLRVDGMSRRGGILWMAWPTSIVTALEERQGVSSASYDLNKDLFHVTFDADRVSTDDLLQLIRDVGKQEEMPYAPTVVHDAGPSPQTSAE